MKKISLILLVFLILMPAIRADAMAQISLQNNTSFWLNLFIDGNFGCGPVMPSGFCVSSVTPGSHLLEAKKGDEVVRSEKDVNIGDGTSPTWTVTIKDTPTLEGKWMDKKDGTYSTFTQSGSNYIESNTSPCPGRTFYGGPTEYNASETPNNYACLRYKYSPGDNDFLDVILPQLVGRITLNHRITLSSDGNSATWAADNVIVTTTGHGSTITFKSLRVEPFSRIYYLVRVSLRQQ